MESLARPFRWFYHEFGLASIHETGRNAYLIILARACRTFAYGTNSLILALFFAELKFTDSQIGLFMTLTLLGDVFLGTILTLIADRVGRRKILFGGSFLMVLSGAVFAIFENFWILLFAAVVGVISITGGDFGPFRSIEESILSELTTPSTRSDVLAWYVTIAAWGSSLGSEATGRFIERFEHLDGWTLADTYHALFWLFVIVGLLNAGFVLLLSEACEAEKKVDEDYAQVPQAENDQEIELSETITNGNAARPQSPLAKPMSKGWFAWLAWAGDAMSLISAPTRSVMIKLWILLGIDSLADGMVPYSLTNYYMDSKFHPAKSTLGDVSSVGFFLAAMSALFAGPLAKRIGLINTMVFTHLPSSAAVLLFPLPSVLWLTVVLLFVRAGLNNMDQAPRAAFIAAVVKPEERTAVMGLTAMVRTLAATAGPTFTGLFANNDLFWLGFVLAGSCRITYDLGLYALFVNMKLYQHEQTGSQLRSLDRQQRQTDEEMFSLGSSADEDVDDEDDFENDSDKSRK